MFAHDDDVHYIRERHRCIIIKIKPAFMALSFPPDFLVFHIRGGPDLAARKATRGSHSVSRSQERVRHFLLLVGENVNILQRGGGGENHPPLFGAADGKLKQRSS